MSLDLKEEAFARDRNVENSCMPIIFKAMAMGKITEDMNAK